MKRFLEWIGLKQKLHEHEYNPPLITEGDLWWCSVGENVGIEANGKHDHFTRPVVVLKKFGRLGFLGIPTTTRQREGSWYVPFTHQGIAEIAMLNQGRVLSYKRLDRKMGTLDDADFQTIREAYQALFKQ